MLLNEVKIAAYMYAKKMSYVYLPYADMDTVQLLCKNIIVINVPCTIYTYE